MGDRIQRVNKDENIQKLTLPNGLQVGIINLGTILDEVASLGLMDPEIIQAELLARVKSSNFVAPGAEREYTTALLEEYRNRYDSSGKTQREIHKIPDPG